MAKFNTLHWNDYDIRLLHPKGNIRKILNLIPYFWDDEVNFTLAVRQPRNIRSLPDLWEYQWSLFDLDGKLINEGAKKISIIRTKWLRRYLVDYWTSGKDRAIVLGNLSPYKYYMLKVQFTNEKGESIDGQMATFSIKDRTDFYTQIFLILFSIVAALFFALLLKGCGYGSV